MGIWRKKGNDRYWVVHSKRMNKVLEPGEEWVFGENMECSILGIWLTQEESGV